MIKLKKLDKIIRGYGSCLIAYSGGVDSTFLMHACARILPKHKILVVTAFSETYPAQERSFAKNEVRKLNLRHLIIKTQELKDKRFAVNSALRCYYCKSELFSRLSHIASLRRIAAVFDASTVSDIADYRPGRRAKQEWRISSPLLEAGFTKEEIRRISRKWRLTTQDKPSLACLASRIPYGTKISPRILNQVNKAEVFLSGLGFKQVRLRHYGDLCRIEVPELDIPRLLRRRDMVIEKLKALGYNYVTVDLQGYRTGSMNESLKKVRHP